MDLEGLSKQLLKQGKTDAEIISRLLEEYRIYKSSPESTLILMSQAILKECKRSLQSQNVNQDPFLQDLLKTPLAGVTMGEQGVGCRGYGDFFVHEMISKISRTNVQPLLSPEALDDTGAVEFCGANSDQRYIILTKMEGMHSRLSDFPFLAGFHVTRAAIRDIMVKGGIPISLMVDLHLADDGDVGKLFDFQAGVATVSELAGVPITAGSTLRIGGDMVIGNRLTGGISAVGVTTKGFFRRNIQSRDAVIMTEGAGGGTIATTALYGGKSDVVLETLNVKFLDACRVILKSEDVKSSIHAMTDVTNGGLRGDLFEINREAKLGVKIYPDRVRTLINSKVLVMLDELSVDYLGVSLDALLIYCAPESVSTIQTLLSSIGVKSEQIGVVLPDQQIIFADTRGEERVVPRFREAAYTTVKQIVDQNSTKNEANEGRLQHSFNAALQKKQNVNEFIKLRKKMQ